MFEVRDTKPIFKVDLMQIFSFKEKICLKRSWCNKQSMRERENSEYVFLVGMCQHIVAFAMRFVSNRNDKKALWATPRIKALKILTSLIEYNAVD